MGEEEREDGRENGEEDMMSRFGSPSPDAMAQQVGREGRKEVRREGAEAVLWKHSV